ncbi:hypothetical protein ACLOJK_033576 [Asimina triloba]
MTGGGIGVLGFPSALAFSLLKPFPISTATTTGSASSKKKQQQLLQNHCSGSSIESLAMKTLDESDLGILCYISKLPGFRGVLKHRYSDFIVNEVDCDGNVVHLTSFDLPPEVPIHFLFLLPFLPFVLLPAECNALLFDGWDYTIRTLKCACSLILCVFCYGTVERTSGLYCFVLCCVLRGSEEKESKTLDSTIKKSYTAEIESFRSLAGVVDAESLKEFLERIVSGAEADASHIVLSPDSDKSHRTEIHNFFKTNFTFLTTDTLDGPDSCSKCIRVRFSSGSQSGQGRNSKKRKERGNREKSKDDKPFHLYKENKDTQEALGLIGKMLGIQVADRVTVFKQHVKRLAALNDRLIGIKVGNFCYVHEELVLGKLLGNRFTITLRGVVADSEDTIKASANELGKNGFINYFALFDIVDNLIFCKQRDTIKEVREYYKESGDIDGTLRQLPRYLIAERAIVHYDFAANLVFDFLSYIVTIRIIVEYWNGAVVLGDLVYCKGNSQEKLQEVVNTEPEDCSYSDAHDDSGGLAEIPEVALPEDKVLSVKVVDAEDLLTGEYTVDDIILPLPGEILRYKDCNIPLAETDMDIIAKSLPGGSEISSISNYDNWISESRNLGSRRAGSIDNNENIGEIEKLLQAESVCSPDDPLQTALKLSFTLPASSYATMAIRELLKTSTSHQKKLKPGRYLELLKVILISSALQAWKSLIFSDPNGLTSNWNGPNVCSYNGVFCAPSIYDPLLTVVAGIDLNHGNIAGSLPEELGLLIDLALLHLNTNRFCGTLPQSFRHLHLLFELDLSNNLFSGSFPTVLLSLPSLKYLDIRYNDFVGDIPSALFDLDLDAIFINNNRFQSPLPPNLGNSPVSVLVAANNDLGGCLPPSVGNMSGTLNEIILLNDGLTGCLHPEIGQLTMATVFDVGFNRLVGSLPETMGSMVSLEQLNVGHNQLSGSIPASVCSLPKLENFTYSYNYFSAEPPVCLALPSKDDRENCIPGRPLQRSQAECAAFLSSPISCKAFGCSTTAEPTPTPTPTPTPPVGCSDGGGAAGSAAAAIPACVISHPTVNGQDLDVFA